MTALLRRMVERELLGRARREDDAKHAVMALAQLGRSGRATSQRLTTRLWQKRFVTAQVEHLSGVAESYRQPDQQQAQTSAQALFVDAGAFPCGRRRGRSPSS